MAGPSPVSALIHAATMVAAGVFVIARMFPLFLQSPITLTVMAVVACLTMLGAALAAFAQDDIKRVLAWSTVSQLAYMVAALAVGSSEAAVFHLLSHAFFKALLFLAAGAVIHSVGSSVMRDMGGLRRAMPITYATMSIGLLALVGVVPLSGFFSKESVLDAAESAARGEAVVSSSIGWLVLVTAVITVAVTAGYVVRLWLMTFLGPERHDSTAREVSVGMTGPLVALAIPTVLFGFVGLSEAWLPTWMTPNATQHNWIPEALKPEPLTIVLSIVAVVVGAAVAWTAAGRAPDRDASRSLGSLRPVLASGFGVDTVYRWVAIRPFRAAVRTVVRIDDRLVAPAVQAAGRTAVAVGSTTQRAQRGDAQRYLSAALTGVVVAVVLILVAVAT
jgi:NADH-quinone oxidoreductase subunit L